LTAFTVGGALAVSGTAYQAVLRNTLAEPYILGISGGASLGAAFAIMSGAAAVSNFSLLFSSFTGAVLVLFIVLAMARGAGAEYTNNVMLSGVIAGTVCSSILMFIISMAGSQKLSSITWWMLGNLQPKSDALLITVAVILLVSGMLLFLLGREANAISMGDEAAYYLGIAPGKVVLIILALSSLLTASAVAMAGVIGFVGLIIPHILRKLFGANHRMLFPLSILCGGMFLMVCDTFSRTVLSPRIIPVGVITALTGGPFFLWLLNRNRRKTL
jgi:iron complex transport system permease protein